MSLTFRQVLPAIEQSLSSLGGTLNHVELTIVVDAQGSVRAIVAPHNEASTTHVRDVVAELTRRWRDHLGGWLAADEPVVEAKRLPAAVLTHAELHRKDWPLAPRDNVHLLDRVIARHGWVHDLPWSPPWTLAEVDASQRPPIWVFFSHKGGVGRTTAVAAVGSLLARQGLRVLAVDLDVEAPGLGDRLLRDGPGNTTVLDVLVGPDDEIDARARDAVRSVEEPDLVGAGQLYVAAAGEVDADYLRLLARLDLQGSVDARAALRRMGSAINSMREACGPDIILLDARAGFHDVGGLALAGLAHGVVFFGRDERATRGGLSAVARALAPHRDADGGPSIVLLPAHAHAPSAAAHEDEELRRFEDMAFDVMEEEGYLGESSDRASDSAYRPQPIPFNPALRASDGLITSGVLFHLDPLHSDLATRIQNLFEITKEPR